MRNYVALVRQERGTDFSVEFPDLPGCVSAGETLHDAIDRAADVLCLHAADMIRNGLSLPDPTPLDAVLGSAEARDAAAFLVSTGPPRGQLVRVEVPVDEHFLKQIDAAAAERGMTRSAFLREAARRQMRPSPAPGADLARAVDALIETGGKPVDVIKEVIAREGRTVARKPPEVQIISMPDRHGDDPSYPVEPSAASTALTTIEQELLSRVLRGEEGPAIADSFGIDTAELQRLLDDVLNKLARKESS